MSDKTYEMLRFIALAIAPVSTFIAAILSIWAVPYATEITASLAALTTLVAAVVEIARQVYNKKNAAQDPKKEGEG